MGSKYLISVDLEGIHGISNTDSTNLDGKRYQEACQLMVNEVNTVVEGIFTFDSEAEIRVRDAHGMSRNLSLADLDERVHLIQGWGNTINMGAPLNSSYHGIFLVGYHAGPWRTSSALSHVCFSNIKRVVVNNQSLDEAGLVGLYASDFNVPVIFCCGDETTCQDVQKEFSNITTVPVKKSYARNKVNNFPKAQVKKALTEGVVEACKRLKNESSSNFLIQPPFDVAVEIYDTGYSFSTYQGIKDVLNFDPNFEFDDEAFSVHFKSQDGKELLSRYNLLLHLILSLKTIG